MSIHSDSDALEVQSQDTNCVETPPNQKKRRQVYFTLISWSISILLLLGMFHVVPFKEVWRALHQVNPLFILLAMIFSFISFLLMGYRWALLFSPHYQVSHRSAFSLVMIGLAINATLPGRVGELARIGLAVKKFRTSVTFTTATVVIERLFDVIMLLTLLGVSLFFLPHIKVDHSVQLLGYTVNSEVIMNLMMGLVFICLSLMVLVIGFAIPYTRKTIHQLLSKIPFMGQWFNRKTAKMFNDIGKCLSSLKEVPTISKLLLYSITIWLAIAICNYLVSLGMIGIQLTFLQAIVVTSISNVASSIPSAPGGWGVSEAGALFALVISGVPFEPAVGLAYVLTIHIVGYLLVVLLGITLALREHVSLNSVKEEKS
jgi:hypothetical protein